MDWALKRRDETYRETGGVAVTTTAFDALGRPLTVTDGGGTTTYNYTQTPGSSPVGFDVLVTVSGSPNVARQYEYDGLGRLTSVCEVNTCSGYGACGQSVSASGYLTKYTYDVLNDLLTVNQNAQPNGTLQTRTYTYDGLGRMTSEKNPETSQVAYGYTFDTDATCGTHNGDLVKRADPQGTVTCYAYDALHRLTGVTYPSGGYSSVTPSKTYAYDTASGCGATLQYPKGRLAEAYTGSSKTTDLCFSYTNRGEVAAVYQSSPHSAGYYHVAATYWAPRGLLDTLNPNMTGIPTWTYKPEGEGRVNIVSASAGQNPVTGTSHNGFSEATGVTFGSSDSDAFQYDPATGRMTQYKANVGSAAMTGTLTWNANWTLGTLGITDALNPADTQSCTYAYDNLARLTSAGCGSVWSQSFTYDAFGNIKKSGSQSFQPTYSPTTNKMTNTGAVTPTYDSNGNLTYDGFYNYAWDGEGNLATLNSNAETYDALNRRVEQYNGSAYTEIVYGPGGNKFALMNGQAATKVFAPLSAGATAVYNSAGLSYYRHPDWLGSSRVASTTSRTVYYDGAYAPFGENYAETGTTDRNFTGQNQDLTPGSTGLLYDFLYREQHSTQGRWISPDPAGVNAVDPTNPQSWNRYAYVLNNPLSSIDPLGLDTTAYQWIGNCLYESDATSSTATGPDGTITMNVTWGPWSLLWCSGGSMGVIGGSVGGGGVGGGSRGTPKGSANSVCIHPTDVQRALIPIQAAAASYWNKTLLAGLGASAGAGFGKGLGLYGSVSAQIAVSPSGAAGYVLTFAAPAAVSGVGTYGWLTASTKGAGFLAGSQFGISNATNPSQLAGPGVDASASLAAGLGIGGDASVSIGNSALYQLNVTLGFGAGGRGSAGALTNTTVIPFCKE
jgi:RHS repeat-associated protein